MSNEDKEEVATLDEREETRTTLPLSQQMTPDDELEVMRAEYEDATSEERLRIDRDFRRAVSGLYCQDWRGRRNNCPL
jgi:hypothetical protein